LSIVAFNHGKIIVLGAGNREDGKKLKDRVDDRHSREIPIYLRQMGSHENKCVWFAVCLCVHLQCPQDAKIMQMRMMQIKNDDIEKYTDLVIFKRKSIISGGALSELLECNTEYKVQRIKGLPANGKERTTHLLEKTEGCFIAVLQYTSDACHHCICIDGTNKLIFDAAESSSIPLNKVNLNMCCGSSGDFQSIGTVDRITRKTKKKD